MSDDQTEQKRIPVSLGGYPEIQNRLLTLVSFACALPSLIVGAYSIYLIYGLSRVAESSPAAEALLSETYSIGILVAVIYGLSVLLIVLVTLLFSHRLVGPLDRLRNELDEMVEKQDIHLLRVREDDYLRPFFETINRVLLKLVWKQSPDEE